MTLDELTAPMPISADHDLASFDCGIVSLNDWLKRQAVKNETGGASRTYVVCAGVTVVGYYCLAAGGVARSGAPKPLQRNMPDPIPVLVLGRLATDRAYQGRGIGSALLRDANLRVLQAADVVGVRAILVHAISDDAKRFYLANGFLESAIEPMTLCLPLETVWRSLS